MRNYKDSDIAHIKKNEYSGIYNESIDNNEKFWSIISKPNNLASLTKIFFIYYKCMI